MTAEFNLRPPVQAPISDSNGMLTNEWVRFFQQLLLFFTDRINPNFIFLGTLNTEEISNISDIVQSGTVVYNSTIQKFQGYENNIWVTFTTS